MMFTQSQLMDYYQQACLLELQAFKPGNVSIYSAGHGMCVRDFEVSAQVSASPLCQANYSLGEKIFYAVKATRDAVGCNTNLGIILLAAPLIEAANWVNPTGSLQLALRYVLDHTTVDDANWVFKAIRLASPGGLGESDAHDVQKSAAVTLQDAMRYAAERDRIALQYVNYYADIFDFSCRKYYNAMHKWGSRDWAMVAVYAQLLTHFPDSHIVRKYGDQCWEMVAVRMAFLDEKLSQSDRPEELMPLLREIDQALKAEGVNPGTTADLTVATALTVFLEKAIT